MESTIMALPILPGKMDAVKAMFKTIREQKLKESERANKMAGVEKEQDFVQSTPMGDMLYLYIESKDLQKTLAEFGKLAASKDPYITWFDEELMKNTGVDLSKPPTVAPPENVFSYHRSLL
jgi:hypothetical protein